MNKKLLINLFMILLMAPVVFGTIYVDDLNVLGPGDTFQFQIYTYSNAEKSPVLMSIYKVSDAFSVFLNGLNTSEIEEILSNKEALMHYQIPVESSWQRETFPLTFFKELGGYICKFTRDGKVVYTVVERTDIDGVAIDRGSFVNLEVWHSKKGDRISFGDIYTGFEQIYMGSLSDPLLQKIEKADVKDGLLIIKTPSGDAIVQLDKQDLIKDNAIELIFLSEKPLYRPGEPINLKGTFYDRKTSSLVEKGRLTLSLIDPMGNKLKEQSSDLDQWGGFEFEYQTVEDSIRGHYDFIVQYNDNKFYRYIELSDYQKPEFTVEVEEIQEIYSVGQKPNFLIRSDYYYGQPLQSAQVHMKLDLLPDYEQSFSSKTLDIRFKNLTDGVATGTLPILGEAIEDYSVEFTVVDPSGREVSAHKYFKYIPSNVQIKTEKWRYWNNFGQLVNGTFSMNPLVKDANVSDRPLNFEIYRKGNLVLDEVYETDKNGTVNFSFDPVLPGYYTLKITDAEYPNNQLERSFFVYSSNYSYATSNKLDLIADKENYKPSEVINLKLLSSLQTLNLLAVFDFGNSVMSKNVEIKNNVADLSFVIPPDMTRNSVSVRLISFFAGEKITLNKEIPVTLDRHLLNIDLHTPNQVQPGDQVEYTLSLSDAQGNPVNGVVTLNVIDQSLLDLYGDDDWKEVLSTLENPPFNYYFESFNNVHYISKDNAENMLPYDTPDTLAQTKKAALGKSVKVRSDFSDSALWLPVVVVDGEIQSAFSLPESLTTWNMRSVGFTADGKRGYASTDFVSTLPVTVNEIFPKFMISGDEVELGMNVGNYSGEDLQFELVFEGPSFEEKREIFLSDQQNTIQWFRYKVPHVEEKELLKFHMSALSDNFSDAMIYEIPVHPYTFTKQLGQGGIITRDSVEQILEIPVETEISVRISANLENELVKALEYLIDYPYGCTEQTVSSFLPSVAFMQLKPDYQSETTGAFSMIPDITEASLKRLYSFQNYEGGWGWWKNGESDQFMTSYVLYTFYKLMQMEMDVNQQSFERGKQALKSLIETTEKPLPFSEYVLSLLDPSHTIVLTDQQSASSKLFLSLTMMERNQKEVALSLLHELLKEGKTVGGIFKINFDQTSYFINDVVMNALLFELMIKTGYDGEEVNGLFKYLYGKKTGRFWSSTKDTAFIVMALSHYVFEEEQFDYSLITSNTSDETESLATGVLHKGKAKEYVFNIASPASLKLSLSGSTGLLWEISMAQTWDPLDERLTSTSEQVAYLSRSFQVKRDVSVVDVDGEISYESLYIPIQSDIRLDTLVEYGGPIPETVQPVKIESFNIEKTPENSWSHLYLNHSETGIRIPEGVKLIGMDATSLTFDRNPFSDQEGKWRFLFEENEDNLVVGDEIRSTITLDLPVEYNWAALEEYLPSCFVQNESDMDNYYFGKYFSTRSYLWTYYTSNIENRFDRTSVFFDFVEEGLSIYQNHYKVIASGEFLIPPLKLFQMYEVDSDYVAPGLVISVNQK